MAFHIERLAARDYYRKRAPGVVVLVNGQPMHFAGKACGREADAYIQRLADHGIGQVPVTKK